MKDIFILLLGLLLILLYLPSCENFSDVDDSNMGEEEETTTTAPTTTAAPSKDKDDSTIGGTIGRVLLGIVVCGLCLAPPENSNDYD